MVGPAKECRELIACGTDEFNELAESLRFVEKDVTFERGKKLGCGIEASDGSGL